MAAAAPVEIRTIYSAAPKARLSRNSALAARLSILTGGLDYGGALDWEDLAPETILPAHWRPAGGLCECGCQSLALGVLLNAVTALHRPIPGSTLEKSRPEAVQWFVAPEVMINLRDVCEALGLDVKQVQRRVLRVIRRAPGD